MRTLQIVKFREICDFCARMVFLRPNNQLLRISPLTAPIILERFTTAMKYLRVIARARKITYCPVNLPLSRFNVPAIRLGIYYFHCVGVYLINTLPDKKSAAN